MAFAGLTAGRTVFGQKHVQDAVVGGFAGDEAVVQCPHGGFIDVGRCWAAGVDELVEDGVG